MKSDQHAAMPTSRELQNLRCKAADMERYKAEHEKADAALRESEEKYRTLVENVDFGIYRNTGGPHGRFLQANPAIARMFGFDSVDELMKVPVSSLYQNPEQRKHFIDEAARVGYLRDKEIPLKKKDGTQIVGSCTSKVQYNDDGSIKWIDGVIEDITERKKAEESIEKSRYYEHTISSVLKVALEPVPLEEQLNRILDLILEIPYLSLQPKGCIYLVEDDTGVLLMKAHHGFSSEELCECSRLPFVSPSLCGQAALKGEIMFSDDVSADEGKRPDNLPYGQYCIPISSGDQLYGILSIVLKEGHRRNEPEEKFLTSIANTLAGVIAHRKTEMEKDRLHSQLVQAEKLSALGRMTANVAHEIRNPLTVLGGLAKRLNRTMAGGTKEKEYTDIIVSEAARLEKILRSVLSFTREEHIHKEMHNIQDIVNESLKIMEVLYAEKSIKIETRFDDSVSVPIDKTQVREVIDNLISNAAEAMSEGGKIIISSGRDDVKSVPYYTLNVTDTGKGMSRDEKNNIFEPFFTTKAVGTGDGIGLGLAICKKIMDEHAGFIKVRSDVGKGSTFTLYFPINNQITAG